MTLNWAIDVDLKVVSNNQKKSSWNKIHSIMIQAWVSSQRRSERIFILKNICIIKSFVIKNEIEHWNINAYICDCLCVSVYMNAIILWKGKKVNFFTCSPIPASSHGFLHINNEHEKDGMMKVKRRWRNERISVFL